jgi:hypothetical protein
LGDHLYQTPVLLNEGGGPLVQQIVIGYCVRGHVMNGVSGQNGNAVVEIEQTVTRAKGPGDCNAVAPLPRLA